MADCENTETFVFIRRVVGADLCYVKLFLVAADSKILKVSATHVVVVVVVVVIVIGLILDMNRLTMQKL